MACNNFAPTLNNNKRKSSTGLIQTEIRNRLSAETLESITFLKENS